MTRREHLRLAAALLIGAAIAFPAGLMLGEDDTERPGRPRPAAAMRDMYAPTVLDDPYFIDRQRANVDALEAHCRRSGQMCAEAATARRWLARQGAE